MARYHVNGKGEAGLCTAQTGNCPFGGELDHYSTPEDARRAYEKVMSGEAWGAQSKKTDPGPLAQPFLPGEYSYGKAVLGQVWPEGGGERKYIVVPFEGKLTDQEKLTIGRELWLLSGKTEEEWETFSPMKKLQFLRADRSTHKDIKLEVGGDVVKTNLYYGTSQMDYQDIFLLPREALANG